MLLVGEIVNDQRVDRRQHGRRLELSWREVARQQRSATRHGLIVLACGVGHERELTRFAPLWSWRVASSLNPPTASV